MKFSVAALSFVLAGTLCLFGLPILSRVQTNRARAERRSQLASKFQSSPPIALNPQSDSRQKAVAEFDKNKASAAAIFESADKVEALRLFADGSEKPLGEVAPHVPFYSRHTVTAPDFAARLGELILDPNSYALPGQSTTQCYIEPAVAFRVWKKGQSADTVICFKCDQLAVLEHNGNVPLRSIGGLLRGRFNVAGDFLPREPLLALTKEAFPNDSAVQTLN